jgi:Ca2+-binding RTX toxin-like protein
LSLFIILSMAAILSRLFVNGPQEAQAQGDSATTFSGQSMAVQATVLGFVPVTLVDTGPLPPEGGSLSNSLSNANALGGTLTTGTLQATTSGQGDQSDSEASVENLGLNLLGLVKVQASLVQADASAACTANGNAVIIGSSQLVGLVVNGQTINVNGTRNQTISLNIPGLSLAKIVINEQTRSQNNETGAIIVNALHITLVNLLGITVADVVISSAHADITCAVCGNGILESGEDCDQGSLNGKNTSCCTDSCEIVTAATQCRAAAGVCDVVESCTGTSGSCPADSLKAAGIECRASAGQCDVAESCTGSSANCPTNGFKPNGTTCNDNNPNTVGETCNNNGGCTGGTTCAFSISPTSASVPGSGGPGNVGVTTTTGCAWTAVSNAPWLTINSGASGTGNGTVNYTVAANSGTTSRAGTLTIAGKTFTVTQAGNTSSSSCGNGVQEAGEACDLGAQNGAAGSCCTASCTFVSAGTTCRAASGACDVAESCTGSSATCPADGFAPNGTSCNDGNRDTGGDTCTNGVCNGSFIVSSCTPQCGQPVCGNPTIVGTSASETLNGTGKNDVIAGNGGNDTVKAGEGNDCTTTGTGNDIIESNKGNDKIIDSGGTNHIDAGEGNDCVFSGPGDDDITSSEGCDVITDSGGANHIHGGPRDDVITGGPGNDTIFGDEGNDTLNGGNGDDYLDGSSGTDKCDGGPGIDTCVDCEIRVNCEN